MRIYNVVISRELDCTIAAESEEALDLALNDYSYEFEDWGDSQWVWTIHDPLTRVKSSRHFSYVDDEPNQPDMALLDGEILNMCDAISRDKDLMDKVSEVIRAHKRKIAQDENQAKLPGIL